MRNVYYLVIPALLVVFIFSFPVELPVVRDLEVSKEVYEKGETVNATFSKFKMKRCFTARRRFDIQRKDGEEWRSLFNESENFEKENTCFRNNIGDSFSDEYLLQCERGPDIYKYNFSWDQEFLKHTENVSSCGRFNESANMTFRKLEYVQASQGRYRVKYGPYTEEFEIR